MFCVSSVFFQQNCLIVIEMDLLSTHNIGFGWGMKTSFEYSYYSVFMIKGDGNPANYYASYERP